MNTQDIRVQKTKKAIRDSLFLILKEKPIDKISISDIATAAKINRKTFYAHYEKVEDIVTEMEDELVENIDNYLQSCIIKEYGLNPYYFMTFVNRLYTTNPEFCENLVTVRNYHFLVDKIKENLLNQLLLSVDAPEEEKYMVKFQIEFFLSGIAAVYVDWIKTGRPCPFEELSSVFLNIVKNALKGLPNVKLHDRLLET